MVGKVERWYEMKKSFGMFTVLLISTLMFITNINAECSYEQISKLKKIAANINYDINYVMKNNIPYFQVRFVNVPTSLTIINTSDNKSYNANRNNEVIISDLNYGKIYRFKIKLANLISKENKVYYKAVENGKWVNKVIDLGTEICDIEEITSMLVTLPVYNPFYNSEICKKYTTNKMCQKWYEHNLSYSDFEKEIIMIENNKKIDKPIEEKTKLSFVEMILDFTKKYYIPIGIITICLICAIVVIIKNRKDTGFEGW